MVAFRIAIRYLFSKKSNKAVNIIALISLAGVAVASMATVCVLSVFNGFSDLATAQLSILDPDLKITPQKGKVISDADSLTKAITVIDGVKMALPTIEEQALATFGNNQIPVTIKGIPEGYDSLTQIRQVTIDGEFLTGDSAISYATLSVGTAIALKASPHSFEYLGIYAPRRQGRINPANALTAFRSDSLAVGAVFQTNQAAYDTDIVMIPLDNARRLLGYSHEASAIEVKADDNTDINDLAGAITATIGDRYTVNDRLQQQQQTFRMIEIEKWITFLMLAFILLIASFNIISTLSMLVIEKADNISTLKALGASQSLISRIFTIEGWLISLVGGVAGIIIGAGLVLLQQTTKIVKLSGDPAAMVIDAYPVRLTVTDLITVLLAVFIIGIFTSHITTLLARNRIRNRQ